MFDFHNYKKFKKLKIQTVFMIYKIKTPQLQQEFYTFYGWGWVLDCP